MAKTMLAAQGLDQWIRLELPKGVVLKLSQEEFAAAVKRGRAEARALQQARREEAAQAKQEADLLSWIGED